MTSFEQRFSREFATYDRVIALAEDLLERNSERFAIDLARRRTRAAAMLYARSRKELLRLVYWRQPGTAKARW